MLKTSLLDLFKVEDDWEKWQKYNERYPSGNIKYQISVRGGKMLVINYCRDDNSWINTRVSRLRLFSSFNFILEENTLYVVETHYNNENKNHKENAPAELSYKVDLPDLTITFEELLEKLPTANKQIRKEEYYTNGQFTLSKEYYRTGELYRTFDGQNCFYDKEGYIISQDIAVELYYS